MSIDNIKSELSDFSLDLHQSLAAEGFAKSLDRSIGMPMFFANPTPPRSRHISAEKIAQRRYNDLFVRGARDEN